MSTALPVVKIGRKKYYVDERLNELRSVSNPDDREKMEGSADFYVEHFGSKAVKYSAEEIRKIQAKKLRRIM